MCEPHETYGPDAEHHCDAQREAVRAGQLAGHPNTLALHLAMRRPCGHGLDLDGIELDEQGVATVSAADEWHRAEHEVDASGER